MNDNVTWLELPLDTDTLTAAPQTQETDMTDMSPNTDAALPAEAPVRHGQIILGVVAVVAAVSLVLNLTTSVFTHALALPVVMLALGVFVLVYGLVALRAGRPLHPGEEERRERQALTRITKQEQRRARRMQRRAHKRS